jgi:transposase
MGKPLSIDLRVRALAAVDAGLSRRAAAERFGVSASSVIRWDQARRERGDPGPKPQGGDRTSHRIETHADFILSLLDARGDITLEEIRAALSKRGVHVAVSTIWRFFERRAITRKKRQAMRANRTGQTS